MKVIIIGAGIGGLICAIACRRENLDVTVLERAPALAPVGAGIQIPPNAASICRQLGVLPGLIKKGVVLDSIEYVGYKNGNPLFKIEGGSKVVTNFGAPWLVISRFEYHQVLWDAARETGVNLCLGSEVEDIDFDNAAVRIKGGPTVKGDVVVGADGLWSLSRNLMVGRPSPPTETGDLAYRGTISRERLQALNDPEVDNLALKRTATCWMGPGRHCVFYPLSGGEQFNLVLLRPDNLSKNLRQASGDLKEMSDCFKGWDSRLSKIMSCFTSVLKWKLFHFEELESWTKGNVALLGDACHPTLPYQAQGAAMASEDGAVLGKLLGLLNRSGLYAAGSKQPLRSVLRMYESLRKKRTTTNVKGAISNRFSFHLADGSQQKERDAFLLGVGGVIPDSKFLFANENYLRSILAFDSVGECVKAFYEWSVKQKSTGNYDNRL